MTAAQECRIDLHLHTTCSDGTLTPAETVAAALAQGLTMIAVTDHDTTQGVRPARHAATGTGLRVVTGIELNTYFEGQEIHILGYGMDPASDALEESLHEMRDSRSRRNEAIILRLAELGVPVSAAAVAEQAQGDIVARPHIARALLKAGYVTSVTEAFDRYLKQGAAAYVERRSLTPQEACQVLIACGGLPVIAHSGKTDYARIIPELVPFGLRGVEVYHPEHDTGQRRRLRNVAEKYGLLVTGGSDSHGPESGRGIGLGDIQMPARVAQEFIAALPN